MDTLRLDIQGPVATITLARPDVRNAFNARMIAELRETVASLDASVRVVVLTGDGDIFSAGADLTWMQQSAEFSEQDNARDAEGMLEMFKALDRAPQAVVARINGPAFGGALGLIACCDMAVASDTARFGFTEVRLGIVPAVISPFVIPKIGVSQARRYFLTGEQFDANQARAIGLVHEVVPGEQLDASVTELVGRLLKGGPRAIAEAKQLIAEIRRRELQDIDAAMAFAVEIIARLRTSPEGQEGLRSFLEKRRPNWR